MKTLNLCLAALLCLSLAACERHPAGHAGRMGARMLMRDERAQHRGLRRACEADVEQYCAADQTGRDRRACLESHLDKLSSDCKAALDARRMRRRARDDDGGGQD